MASCSMVSEPTLAILTAELAAPSAPLPQETPPARASTAPIRIFARVQGFMGWSLWECGWDSDLAVYRDGLDQVADLRLQEAVGLLVVRLDLGRRALLLGRVGQGP